MEWTIMRIALLVALVLLLVSAGIEDARTREIADAKNIAIALLAPLWWWTSGLAVWPDMAVQIGIALAVFLLFAQAFRIGMMGGGDVKMIAAIALWLPLSSLFRMVLVMSIAGGAVTIAMLVDHRLRVRKQGDAAPAIEVPYGVAIAIAALVTLQEPLFNPFPSI
ncbi:prepilin peptidase [Sphingomonas sanguinis]|uniref:Prepilin peptidase n=1 Tax=Sphingomonas sanguinis TaxID=33051 RepID=A0ABU5LTY0_9SPHN|nr:prepilin peptidase [Sphingomonas sanguinis]MDZ7283388.1 prepilin peptidase [Sphingomonas sanguinis]